MGAVINQHHDVQQKKNAHKDLLSRFQRAVFFCCDGIPMDFFFVHCEIRSADTNSHFSLLPLKILWIRLLTRYFWFDSDYIFFLPWLGYFQFQLYLYLYRYLHWQELKLSAVPLGLDLQWEYFTLNKKRKEKKPRGATWRVFGDCENCGFTMNQETMLNEGLDK